MIDSADHFTGKTGATVTVSISKAGGAFAGAAGAVSEIGNGYYKIALTTADTNTLGDLAFRCTAAGCDDTGFVDQIVDPAALLKLDWTTITGEAARSALNALRVLRNRWAISGTTRTVYKEDDSTSAWSSTLSTTASADIIIGDDPA